MVVVVHLAALLADAHEPGAARDIQVVGHGRPAEGDPLGDLADGIENLTPDQVAAEMEGGQRRMAATTRVTGE